MKYLKASIVCFVIAILFALMIGCQGGCETLPEGEITTPPIGYEIHCREFPDSVFCEDK